MSKADSKHRPGLIPRLDVPTYVFHSLGTDAGVSRTITEEQTIKIYSDKYTNDSCTQQTNTSSSSRVGENFNQNKNTRLASKSCLSNT